MKLLRLRTFAVVLVLFFVSTVLSHESYSYFQPPTAGGKYILLRLEDVGPGGFYGTPEGIGKLRTVIEYLTEQKIPYHIAVVSRWKTYDPNNGWTDQGIDTPTPITESFVSVLRYAQDHGALLGMHGYSHQWGNVPRADGQENSGYGYEFNINGEPVSTDKEYAAERIEKSLKAFEANGLKPAFWESPHYHSARQQQEVFRSYMGIIYEPNWSYLRSLRDVVYIEDQNDWKEPSLGSVYIPAPLRYVYNEGRVQKILDQLKDYHGLASMYFHPYMEFSHMEPVMENGKPVIRDGLPVYSYKEGEESPLHKLLDGIKQTHYLFGTIHDIVPFSPAHQVQVTKQLKREQLIIGDMNNDGRDDWVTVDPRLGEVDVTLSNSHWPRNIQPNDPVVWLRNNNVKEASVSLLVRNEVNKRSDLLLVTKHQLLLYKNEGDHFQPNPTLLSVPNAIQSIGEGNLLEHKQWVSPSAGHTGSNTILVLSPNLHKGLIFQIYEDSLATAGQFDIPALKDSMGVRFYLSDVTGDSINDLILFDSTARNLWVLKGESNHFAEASLWYSGTFGEQAAVGDTNGDGKADMVFYNQKTGIWQILRSTGFQFQKIPAFFGPWGRMGKGMIDVGDWDGNGKSDIAVYNPDQGTVDTALSFQK